MSTAGVKGHPPRVAEAVGEDLTPGIIIIHERVVAGNAIFQALVLGVDIDPQDLAEHVTQILTVPDLLVVTPTPVIGKSTITNGDIQVSIWAEFHRTTIMVELRLFLGHQDSFRTGIRDVRIVGHCELGNVGSVIAEDFVN